MSTLVYVVNQNGNALMPCHPSKARKLLRDRRAKVIGRSPFTIKLLWDCEEQVQEVTLGIDKGSYVTGVSGHLDQIAQRTMQGKSHMYATLGGAIPLSTLFGYQTATLRKERNLPKAHDADAPCLATYSSGELVPYDREHFFTVVFRHRRTRRRLSVSKGSRTRPDRRVVRCLNADEQCFRKSGRNCGNRFH